MTQLATQDTVQDLADGETFTLKATYSGITGGGLHDWGRTELLCSG
jgi:hypothetical protein